MKQVCQTAKKYGAVTLIDADQSGGHAVWDVEEIGWDFLVFSSDKCCGPTGIGVLYGRQELLDSMEPYQTGGEMIVSVDWNEAKWKPAPHRFEAGTPHIAGAVGLAKAFEYLESIDRRKIEESDHFFGTAAAERLRELPKMVLLGPVADRAGILSFQLGAIHAHDLVAFADPYGVALRAGLPSNPPLIGNMGCM